MSAQYFVPLMAQLVLQKLNVFVQPALFELLAPTLSPSHAGPETHVDSDNPCFAFLRFV
jgi:hypothetical protein